MQHETRIYVEHPAHQFFPGITATKSIHIITICMHKIHPFGKQHKSHYRHAEFA
jgi:hypothetical protein